MGKRIETPSGRIKVPEIQATAVSLLAVWSMWWSSIVCPLVSEFHFRCLFQTGPHQNPCKPVPCGPLMNAISVNVTRINSITLQMRLYIMTCRIHVFTQRIIVNIPITPRLMIFFGSCETGMSWRVGQDGRIPPGNDNCAGIPCHSTFGCSVLFIDSIDFGALMSKNSARSGDRIDFFGLVPKINVSPMQGPFSPCRGEW